MKYVVTRDPDVDMASLWVSEPGGVYVHVSDFRSEEDALNVAGILNKAQNRGADG